MREIWGQHQEGMNLADLHVHTNFSRDARAGMTPEQAVELAERIQIDSIAITDHDTFESALAAWNYAQKRNSPVAVVPGMEISSREGHVIALFLQENIPPNMPLTETITAVHEQGGLAIIPHPGFTFIRSVERNSILDLAANPSSQIRPDGYEIFNGGVYDFSMRKTLAGKQFPTRANQENFKFYKKYKNVLGAPIASSDAHRKTFGRFVTGYGGDLKQAIKDQKTVALARTLDEVETILGASQNVFGDSFDRAAVTKWIEQIKPLEDQYFSYLGK